ncbi:hypothetical protein [Acinetobacter nosocomialis]|uniref:hypothetical protein n=1 Tax=Acinetobacter nosocomialis TaxID=106654 RepID=UPI00237DA3EF|nr:hypothetical protein [Acinetobacter nosocomialis]MDE3323591.1 hypothetical protein [Acinetobacter nosocomialis]
MELVLQILGSLGGGALIIMGFSNFLSKIWLDRITKQNSFLVDKNLAAFKNQHTQDLEGLKSLYNSELEGIKQKNIEIQIDKQNFHQISNSFYQNFFEKRVDVYLKLLEMKNKYIMEMNESLMIDFHEGQPSVAFSTYKEMRLLINKEQFYISTELDKLFLILRNKAASFLKDEEMVEAKSFDGQDYEHKIEQYEDVYYKFLIQNSEEINAVFEQIDKDIALLRKRAEL